MAGIRINEKTEQTKTEKREKALLALLLFTGVFYVWLKAFESIAPYALAYAIGGGIAGMLVLLMNRKRSYLLLSLAAVLGMGISFLGFGNGAGYLVNDVRHFLIKQTGRLYADYPVGQTAGCYLTTAALVLLFALLFAGAVEEGRRLFLPALLTVTVIATLAGFLKPDTGYFLMLAAAALAYGRFGGSFTCGHFGSRILLILILSGMAAAAVYGSGVKGQPLQKVSEAVKEQLHEVIYHCGSVMPEGKLSDLGAWEKTDETALTVTMEQPQKLYLRGWLGETYTGTAWKQADGEELFASRDLFYRLHREGFYGQSQLAFAMQLTRGQTVYQMTIEPDAACRKYRYLPYALYGNELLDQAQIGDAGVHGGSGQTEASYLAGSLPQWYQAKERLVEKQDEPETGEYLGLEYAYRSYVYEQDLQLTDEARQVCKRLMGAKAETIVQSEAGAYIRELLGKRLTYREETVTKNGDNDFFRYTVEQTKQGYSVHYATAAALLLRYCGIPSRYVEGYYLSGEEAAKYQAGEKITLTQAHAHAWAEYYLDGIGWIPFEVTPGYIDDGELSAIPQAKQQNSRAEQREPSGEETAAPVVEQERAKEEQTDKWSIWNGKTAVMLFLLLVLAFFLYAAVRIVRRYQRLHRLLREINSADDKTAIAARYAYTTKLRAYADAGKQAQETEMYRLNQEALFSPHSMDGRQRQAMEDYGQAVLKACKRQWKWWQRIYYHYILWLYCE